MTLVSKLLGFVLEPRVLAVLLVTGAIGLGWWHYTGLRSDLVTAKADLVAAKADLEIVRAQMVAAVEIANNNAEQVKKLEAQQRAVIAAIEQAHEEMTRITDAARTEDEEILSAPPEAGGPVPDVLADHLLRRFGGE